MRRLDASAAVIAAAVLGGLCAVAGLLWSYPRVLLYILLGLIAVMAYAALYLIIASTKAKDGGDATDDGEPPSDAQP